MKPSEQGSFFWAGRNESKQWYAMIKTYKIINISARYQYFCMKPSEQGSFFWAGQNESKQLYAMIKTYKTKISQHNISISTWNLQNRIFLSCLKWFQTVVCYDQNLQNHKYLSKISMLLHETFRTGLVFPSWSKWVQTVVCYDQNLQKHKYLSTISIGLVFLSQCTWVQTYDHLQNRACFSSEQLVKMSPNSGMLWSKLTKT